MSAKPGSLLAWIAALSLGIALAGCGLKGALSLPEKSGNVVIRGGSTATAPATETKVPPAPQKMPPPDLPHSNAGSSR